MTMSEGDLAVAQLRFVRMQQLEPLPPPALHTGAIGWLRANLFSTPFNMVLTFLTVLLAIWIVPDVLLQSHSASLGLNVILLVNLAWAAWLQVGFVRRRVPFGGIERWQTGYLLVYFGWAWIVVLVFPLVFGFA